MSVRTWIKDVAQSIFFDKDNDPSCEFVSDNVQDAIEELCNRIATSASPGFSFGRSGNLAANTWLQCETVASNRAGRWVYINDAVISDIYVGNETTDTFDVSVYHHDGNEVNLTFVGSVSIVAARGGKFSVNFPVPTDKQLAVRIENGSSKNTVVGLALQGAFV
jgi:hypothetical protein